MRFKLIFFLSLMLSLHERKSEENSAKTNNETVGIEQKTWNRESKNGKQLEIPTVKIFKLCDRARNKPQREMK